MKCGSRLDPATEKLALDALLRIKSKLEEAQAYQNKLREDRAKLMGVAITVVMYPEDFPEGFEQRTRELLDQIEPHWRRLC
jgi:hypothetical protein